MPPQPSEIVWPQVADVQVAFGAHQEMTTLLEDGEAKPAAHAGDGL